MKSLLYIGHAYHNKTKSTQFLQEILKTKYEVTTFDFDPYSMTNAKFEELSGKKYDVVVLFQIQPQLSMLNKYLSYDKIVFFPMYDGYTKFNDPVWNEYKNCHIINFSKTLHLECKNHGLSSFYIQYFPEPIEINNFGDEKSVFLWQRIETININTIEKVLDANDISKLYLHSVLDPGMKQIPPSSVWKNKIEISTWFDTKEEMLDKIQKAAIYFAPRELEGIGMSYLEAMAMGRCVIASDKPTMNEYIKDGYNGFLYDIKKPVKIDIKDIRKIQENAINYIKDGYKKWEKNKYKILDWIESDVSSNCNVDIMDSKILTRKNRITSLTLLKRSYTKKYNIYYIFGFIPIKVKRKDYTE